MNEGEIVFTVIGLVISALAAIFAMRQAQLAAASRKDAIEAQGAAEEARDTTLELSRKATAAAERQAKALEESNRLTEEARRPPVFTYRYVSDQVYAYVNSSGRDIEIVSYEVLPNSEAKFVRLHRHPELPFILPAVEALSFFRIRASGARPQAIKVVYRFVGDDAKYEAKMSLI